MIPAFRLSTRRPDGPPARGGLGTLSIHLDGQPCRVGCEWCYLGGREPGGDGAGPGASAEGGAAPLPARPEVGPAALAALIETVERLAFDELALALSEPVEPSWPALEALSEVARRRGRPLAVTTTLPIAREHARALARADRVSLSVDPRKGPVEVAHVGRIAATVGEAQRAAGGVPEVALIVSVVTPEFAERLVSGLLESLVALPSVARVALNALKPPPPWCDRRFWLSVLDRLRPLLARTLDRRLFLDCYVAARLLGLGDCPGRADLSPSGAAWAFRGCVYQPASEAAGDAEAIEAHARGFVPPARCPFVVR